MRKAIEIMMVIMVIAKAGKEIMEAIEKIPKKA